MYLYLTHTILHDAYYHAFQHDSGYFAFNKLSTKTST